MSIALIGNGVLESDKELFFGPIEPNDNFVRFDSSITFPEILKFFKFFPSTSEARRNGWNKPIPNGFSQFKIGKLKRELYILKIL